MLKSIVSSIEADVTDPIGPDDDARGPVDKSKSCGTARA
jgi:hypothetical protein